MQDKASAYACAVFVFMGLALQTVSQGNIACICIQRYVISKHIRAIQAKWRSVHTKTLLLVNLCLGVLSFGVCIAAFDINRIPTLNALCKLSNIMDDKTAKIVTINIVLGTMITFVADVFCFLTFHQLKTQVCVAGSTETNTATSSNRSTTNTDSSARTSIRTRQSKALWTIFIIVTFFNLSTFPPIVGYTLISLHDSFFFNLWPITTSYTLFEQFNKSNRNCYTYPRSIHVYQRHHLPCGPQDSKLLHMYKNNTLNYISCDVK